MRNAPIDGICKHLIDKEDCTICADNDTFTYQQKLMRENFELRMALRKVMDQLLDQHAHPVAHLGQRLIERVLVEVEHFDSAVRKHPLFTRFADAVDDVTEQLFP